MLSQDEYYELLLNEGAKSDKARAEYVRQSYGGGWHLSDAEVLREAALMMERVINSPLLYEGMSWDEWGKVFELSDDLLYKALGVHRPPKKEEISEEEKFYRLLREKNNEYEYEDEDEEEDDDDDGLGWLRKTRLEMAEESEKMGSWTYANLLAIKSQIFEDLFIMNQENKKKMPWINFI